MKMIRTYRNVACVGFGVVLIFLFAGGPFNASAEATDRVLLISSYHPGFPTFFQQIEGIKSTFSSRSILLDIEFMDSKRFSDNISVGNFYDSLSHKLSKVPPYDLILAADDNALSFAVKYQEELFGEIPIIFFGVNNIDFALAQNKKPKITGVVEAVSMLDTLKLIIRLHPETKNIAVLVDGTPSGQGDLKTFYSYKNELDNIDLSEISLINLSFDEFAAQLRQVPETTSIILLSAYKDKKDKNLLFNESLQLITDNLSRPLYHLWYHGMGDGILGGKLINHFNQGKTAAEMALEVLDGRPVEDLAVRTESPNHYIFDYLQMQRFGIKTGDLPEASIIVNRPFSFYESYKTTVWSLLVLFTVLMGFIIALSVSILRYRRAEKELLIHHNHLEELVGERTIKLTAANKELIDSEEKFHSLSDAAFEGIAITKEGIMIEMNDALLKMLGYHSSELIDKAVIEFITPEERENVVSKMLSGYEQAYETSCLRKDGSTLLIEVHAKMYSYKGQQVRVTAVRDISEQKKAAEVLRESEEQFSTLLQIIEVGVVVHGPDTKIILCNKASQNLLGMTEGQLLGKEATNQAWKFCNEDGSDMPLVDYPVNQVINNKKVLKNMILGIHRTDKSDVIWTLVNAVPKFGSDGKIIQVIVTFMDITERRQAGEEREKLIEELKVTLDEVKTLQGFIPICANCKNIRDDEGYWQQIEGYISDHSEAQFSHSICPDCAKKLYPELYP